MGRSKQPVHKLGPPELLVTAPLVRSKYLGSLPLLLQDFIGTVYQKVSRKAIVGYLDADELYVSTLYSAMNVLMSAETGQYERVSALHFLGEWLGTLLERVRLHIYGAARRQWEPHTLSISYPGETILISYHEVIETMS